MDITRSLSGHPANIEFTLNDYATIIKKYKNNMVWADYLIINIGIHLYRIDLKLLTITAVPADGALENAVGPVLHLDLLQ